MLDKFDVSRIDILNISIVSLTKKVRDHFNTDPYNRISLSQALRVAETIKEAHKLGEIRGRALK